MNQHILYLIDFLNWVLSCEFAAYLAAICQ